MGGMVAGCLLEKLKYDRTSIDSFQIASIRLISRVYAVGRKRGEFPLFYNNKNFSTNMGLAVRKVRITDGAVFISHLHLLGLRGRPTRSEGSHATPGERN